ncbi:MAG TPA: class I SAM-dependent methyltransferase [Patescibacteria group bacterium]|nr:class I SAM-dependent methyltransferase [Patescibacteria group bacterium]
MKRVEPNLYTKEYYLNDASGYEIFGKTFGKVIDVRLKKILDLIPLKVDQRILDIGCGRGELALWMSKLTGGKVLGIDYSEDAIKLAVDAKRRWPKSVQRRVAFKHLDIKKLKTIQKYDLVVMTEVLEHLYPDEQIVVFGKINNLLKKDGLLFIHTAPNKWFNIYIYKYWCYPVSLFISVVYKFVFNKEYPRLIHPKLFRTHYHKIMHINEPDYISLWNLFKQTNFKGKIHSTNVTVNNTVLSWKDAVYNFMLYLSPLSKYFPFNVFWGNDFYAILKKAC